MGQNARSLIKRHYRGLIWDSFIHFVQLLKLLGTVDLDTARMLRFRPDYTPS